jgi:hypothetical protein
MLQIESLIASDAQIVTGVLKRINAKNQILNAMPILGALPAYADFRELWLLGAHGADSTMVVDGDFIRSTWHSHNLFEKELADFGWILGLKNLRIVQNLDAHYFYRSHSGQMSRNADTENGWKKLFPLWKEIMKEVFPNARDLFEIYPEKIWLAIVFPSTLIKLTGSEKKLMIKMTAQFLEALNSDSKSWKETLTRRKIIATKRVRISESPVAIRLACAVILHLVGGVLPRKSK